MVMDIEEHIQILTELVATLQAERTDRPALAKLHLSGHFCHAPRPELLDMIEGCGAVVVDDDLFTGFRYISTDVSEVGDPIDALTRWYFDRNTNVPCATRAQKTVDWENYLVQSLRKSGADGVIVLMAKFCEPHMLYYPELRKELNRHEIPHLLIETEHEGLAIESLRTRVEALLETIRRTASVAPATV
jgi:benzoyl-CoA reductase/2-hydroxyglutaryl-CoA dehydratase subunit BcrC/BadD/HgdB